jgi:subtilisin family serine protease
MIVIKSYEPDNNRKWHGAQHDSDYRQIATEEGIGLPMGALPLDPDEVEHVLALPHVMGVVPDEPVSIPEPIDSYADIHTKSGDDAFRFHALLEEREKGILGDGAIVAVLDTGLDQGHGRNQFNLLNIKDFTSSGSPHDRQGHGTWCAGAVCSKEYGFAPQAKLLSGKVLGDDGSGY